MQKIDGVCPLRISLLFYKLHDQLSMPNRVDILPPCVGHQIIGIAIVFRIQL